ncbi:MAG: ParB/RepB/Spo0J family partition protein [Clostridium sp.]|nr:ParB/RepB/Spo0J family partition protein [Clostridium sp.]
MTKKQKILLSKIDSFKDHPFHVNNDESLKELANSIKENGLYTPLTVRLKEDGRYELISGHRRKAAMELLGITETEAYVKELADEEATIEMVDSNMYREKILPSEKAFAYKMKYDAIKHQGKKTSGHDVQKLDDKSDRNIRRYIRLTNLIPELLQLVDDTVLKDKRTALTMGLLPAVELSYLNKEEQKLVYMGITYEDLTPSHGQAKQLRKLSNEGNITFDSVEEILCKSKGNQQEQISFNKERIEKVLPTELLKRDKRYIEQYIIKAIENYKHQEIERGDVYDLDM